MMKWNLLAIVGCVLLGCAKMPVTVPTHDSLDYATLWQAVADLRSHDLTTNIDGLDTLSTFLQYDLTTPVMTLYDRLLLYGGLVRYVTDGTLPDDPRLRERILTISTTLQVTDSEESSSSAGDP